MPTQAIRPATINAKLLDLLRVFIVNIEAKEVIINKKNGIDSIEFKF